MAEQHEVAIIGSGFSGLGTAIRLKQQGRDDFVVLERGDDVGGTWHFNTYPGCACDVPSHLYSFSFAKNPDWTQTYSRQPEIGAYLKRVATEFGVRPHIRLNTNVEGAGWDEDTGVWRIQTSQGEVEARVLVAAAGPLADPKIPDLPGLDEFEGTTFHSARWDHDYDLRGKRVAVIGTGASSIQLVPAIQPEVEQLTVFQRTPPWIFPHTNRPVTAIERRLFRTFPFLQRLVRGGVYVGRETAVLGFVKHPKIMGVVEKVATRHRDKAIADPELRRKVTPDYTIGCKRILPSNKWYPALAQPNVDLAEGGVERVTRTGVVGADGVEREVDAIIFGTGFQVTEMPAADFIRGKDGRTLNEWWGGSPRAYLGTAIPGFPNLFFLLGPNTGLGHSSMVYMIESQIAYVLDALKVMRERGAKAVEVRPEVEEAFNAALSDQLDGTVWNTGCASWYLDDTGRNSTLWPDWTWRFRRRTARFDPAAYVVA
jgi:cation diffusion facilitator CzcD-associated flavoprotein CzcO